MVVPSPQPLAPSIYYYHQSAQYNVIASSDINGNIVERYAYDAYGKPHIFDGSGLPRAASLYANAYLFTGRRYDTETALYYFRGRMYDAELGRFPNRDPAEYPDGYNLYAGYFAMWMGMDPSGLGYMGGGDEPEKKKDQPGDWGKGPEKNIGPNSTIDNDSWGKSWWVPVDAKVRCVCENGNFCLVIDEIITVFGYKSPGKWVKKYFDWTVDSGKTYRIDRDPVAIANTDKHEQKHLDSMTAQYQDFQKKWKTLDKESWPKEVDRCAPSPEECKQNAEKLRELIKSSWNQIVGKEQQHSNPGSPSLKDVHADIDEVPKDLLNADELQTTKERSDFPRGAVSTR